MTSAPPIDGRILVVEDDPASRRGYQLLLNDAGHDVVTAADGADALVKAREQGPFDLILTDVNMPGTDGFQLTEQLRSVSQTRDVPIILVSAMANSTRRVRGLDTGADDFLQKPIDADELVARVRMHLRHATRHRELLERSRQDALTGVLNRGAIDEELDREMQRLRRTGLPLSVLMLDLDDFKYVNDTHGHAAGDAVLRDVTNKLLGLLRTTDRVGRYGGDELLVILPDTDREDAKALVGRLLRAWRRDPPVVAKTGRPVWISVGSATATRTMSAEALVKVADTQMYEHKRSRKG